MTVPVAISAFALWTPGGVGFDEVPLQGAPGPGLAAWPDAPSLAKVHPRARRPHAQATALVQLAHALLSAREAKTGVPPAPPRQELDVLLGTQTGSSAADLDFLDGLKTRGAGFGSPSTFVYTLATAAPAELALAFRLRGALTTVTAGSLSGVAAVARGAARIAAGHCRACLCGGVELGSLGGRRTSGISGHDILALFLLEAAAADAPWPTLQQWEVGFSPAPVSEASRLFHTPESALLALASSIARARTGGAPQQLDGSSPEGHTASWTVAPSPGGVP
ncbi:MAG: hypothetical protein L0Y66_03045 [Myxococcaceae bacterium]|nr:hypothetical protein [Myxococcaceae bacterium]MCI0673309.1 hypothetical protein [Myxococcaceae bacterium]